MRYFLGFLIAIGLIVLVFILILKGFSSGGGTASNLPKPLVSYASTDAVAALTIQGPVVYDQNFQSVQINISQYQTQINIMQGYQNEVVNTQAFANNQTAYAVFLRSIDLAGFANGNTDSADKDYRGFCPFGSRYIYQLDNDGKNIEQFWSTSCGGQGTFKGSVSSVNQLFQAQIPTYNTLTTNLDL